MRTAQRTGKGWAGAQQKSLIKTKAAWEANIKCLRCVFSVNHYLLEKTYLLEAT